MKLNSRGDYCAPGSGLGTVSVNGQPIDSAGTDACWLTDDIILAQHCDTACEIRRFDFASGEIRQEDPAGANWLRAGGGKWRAWLNGHIRGNDGFAYDGYLCDVNEFGDTVVAPPSFDSLTVLRTVSSFQIATGPLGNNATSGPNVRLRGGVLLWQGQDGWHLRHLSTAIDLALLPRTETIYYAVQANPEPVTLISPWIVEQSGRLTARPFNSTQGYVITTDPVYGIDARFVDGKIVIVWASSPGEPPEHQHVCVQDITLPRVELNNGSTEMPPVESVPLLNRVCGFECYTFHDAQTVGNLTMPVRPTVKNWHGVVAPSDRQDIIDSPECWSVYAGENGSYTCEQAVKDARPLADKRKRGLTIYQDSFPLRDDVLDMVQRHDVVSDLCILELNETIPQFKERCRREYDRVKTGAEFWPTINVKGEASSAAEAFIAVTQLAQEQHWPGLRFFAVGRDDVPMAALDPYVKRFMSGITDTPDARILPDDPPPHPIEDTMISYSVANVKSTAKSNPENYLTGERKAQGSGFAIKQANGYYLTITPEGDVSQRPEGIVTPEELAKYVPGAWETFYASGNIAVAEREKGNNGGKPNTVYWFPCVGK